MEAENALHGPGSPRTHWTTDNVGEALPGVATPLGWTVWEAGCDEMCREVLYAIGVYSRAERRHPAEDLNARVFYGRIAVRVEWPAAIGDRMPGTTGPEAVDAMLGRVPETMEFHPTRRRYPFIAVKMPLAVLRSPRRIRRLHERTEHWWRESVAALPAAGEADARAALIEGSERFRAAMTLHGVGLFSGVSPMIQLVTKLVERTGVGDVGSLSGVGGAEMAMVADIWRASRGDLPLSTVVDRHGYHGPVEGEISSRVWREDRAPLERMVAAYAERPDEESPILREAEARARLPVLHREIAAELPAAQRPAARALLRRAARTIPLRGVGKTSFLQGLDVSRAGARRLGELMAADGRLDDPDDVFYLTLGELAAGTPPGAKDLVRERRRLRSEYEAIRLPASWRGTPVPEVEEAPPSEPGLVISGVGASAGTLEGIVRVVHDSSFGEVEPGEILVSHTTDPSWASIMFLSAALVVDIGGMISHAAVVARELGVPCVVNTRCGTEVLRDGDRVRVDGAAGTVELLERVAVEPLN